MVVCLAVAVSCTALFASAAYAAVVTYFGPEHYMFSYEVAQTDGFAPRTYNKLWRPADDDWGAVTYVNTSGQTISGASGYQNPVVDPDNASYARAKCGNISEDDVFPATCNTTKP